MVAFQTNIRAGRYCSLLAESERRISKKSNYPHIWGQMFSKRTQRRRSRDIKLLPLGTCDFDSLQLIQVNQHERNLIYTVGTRIKICRLTRNRIVPSDQTTHQYNADTTLYS